MRKLLYTTVPAAFLLSCQSLPFILKDAELGLEAVEVAVEAEEVFVEDVNKGNANATSQK